MKSSLVLTASFALVALAVSAVPASPQTLDSPRGAVEEVTRSTTPARDRVRPYTFTTRGRIVPPSQLCPPGQSPLDAGGNCIPILCPPGVTETRFCVSPGGADICSGLVTIRFQKRGTTISSRNVSLRPDCTYVGRVSFRTRGRGVLSVRARFQGNVVLCRGPRTRAR